MKGVIVTKDSALYCWTSWTALAMAHDMAHAMYTRGTSPHYSSVMINRSYPTPTLAAPTPIGQNPTPTPGTKWSTKKFDSGIHASAANERYLAMRRDAEDTRPFKGAPYQPANTFVTTGPWRQGTVPWPFSRGKHCPNPAEMSFAFACSRAHLAVRPVVCQSRRLSPAYLHRMLCRPAPTCIILSRRPRRLHTETGRTACRGPLSKRHAEP